MARVVTEELAAAQTIAPPQDEVGTSLVGPTLLEHGTSEQRERFLPPLLRGEESWCQLFSEPGAGSDLAGLATCAVADGDGWTVNGQKVWNSGADIARRGMLLARTDVDMPKHAGMSYFLLDMDQPGIDARPLRQMNGESRFWKVFISDARVRGNEILERPGDGWRVAATTLRHERSSVGGRPARGLVLLPSGEKAGYLGRIVGEVLANKLQGRRFAGNAVPARKLSELARERGVSTDASIRQGLASYYTLMEVNKYTQLRIRAAAAQGRPLLAGASVTKLAISRICRTSRDLSFAILGPHTMLADADAPHGGEFQTVGLASCGSAIGGGTDEIQRNLLGERVLGLPREPAVGHEKP
jgi:alkylation response protein AidB-like acyl-CoA dehydrogenase